MRVLNKHNNDYIDNVFAPDFGNHASGLNGLENHKRIMSAWFVAIPDQHMKVEDVIDGGYEVWFRGIKSSGVPEGPGRLPGISPT